MSIGCLLGKERKRVSFENGRYSGVLKPHWDGNGSLEGLWTTKRDCHLLACMEYKRFGFLCKLEI